MSDYPTVSPSQTIGMKAEARFRTLVSPDRWIVNRVENDFGIDFRVEFAGGGKLRGCDFYVQVKGYSGGGTDPATAHYQARVRCSTAAYWKAKILPVMIVAINVDTGKANFAWFDKSQSLPDRETLSVAIPLDRDHFYDVNVEMSLAPFWEKWINEVREGNRTALYQKLLQDTLALEGMIVRVYEAILFQGLGEHAEDGLRVPETPILILYGAFQKWTHEVALYSKAAGVATPIDQQICAIVDQVGVTLRLVLRFVGEVPETAGAFSLLNPQRALPALPALRRLFREIIEFLMLRRGTLGAW